MLLFRDQAQRLQNFFSCSTQLSMKFYMLLSIKISRKSTFSGSYKTRMLFFPLINVKMPTIVGILTFMSRKNFMLSSVENEKSFITSGPGLQKGNRDNSSNFFSYHISSIIRPSFFVPKQSKNLDPSYKMDLDV